MKTLTKTFSALADPTRLRIVENLVENGETAASTFVEGSGMSAPAISRHLKVLREAGLVTQRVQGTHRLYSADPAALQLVADWVTSHSDFWSGSAAVADTATERDTPANTADQRGAGIAGM